MTDSNQDWANDRDDRGRRQPLIVVLARPIVEILETVAPAFVIALLINLFLAQSTYVYGRSMEPNLHTDQRLVVEKVSYRLRAPQRGDIVVISVPNSEIPLIKRVIPSFAVHSCYLENISTQGAMVRGGTRIPFTYQYIDTPPYLYYVDQMVRWGLGAPLALVSFGGLAWAVGWMIWRRRSTMPGEAVLLAWALPFFIVTGSFQVKFLRLMRMPREE